MPKNAENKVRSIATTTQQTQLLREPFGALKEAMKAVTDEGAWLKKVPAVKTPPAPTQPKSNNG